VPPRPREFAAQNAKNLADTMMPTFTGSTTPEDYYLEYALTPVQLEYYKQLRAMNYSKVDANRIAGTWIPPIPVPFDGPPIRVPK
jgi:hypothetical protein